MWEEYEEFNNDINPITGIIRPINFIIKPVYFNEIDIFFFKSLILNWSISINSRLFLLIILFINSIRIPKEINIASYSVPNTMP